MSLGRHVARRAVVSLVAIYLVVTLSFGFVALTPDPNQAAVAYETQTSGGDAEDVKAAIAAYRSAHNLDDPILQRYTRWVVDISTFDWGISYSMGAPVTSVIAQRLPYTALYVVPALFLSLVSGVAVGLYSAFNRHGLVDRVASVLAYTGFGVPNFWLAEVFLLVVVTKLGLLSHPELATAGSFWSISHLEQYVVPTLVLASGLFAGQLRYARAESLEYVNAEFVAALKAKGVSNGGVARHVLRNAAIPILSLFFADMVAVLVVDIFVIEKFFGIRGLSWLTIRAVSQRDMPLVLGVTMVIGFVGIAANFLQDVTYAALDPRIGDGER
ncbi:ABC transporter permease [Halorussus halophilus]|uniref:ABC transporter permease n=1 Tax=Halorussus halophilus TaxID=2650975 RepID=UPI001301582E|nr:ABC transporter permease [Halorussus halophilus]